MIYAIIIVAVIAIGVAAAAFTGVLFPRKPSIELWYNSDGHYGDTEPAVAQVIKDSLEKTGKFTVTLKSEPWATYTDDFGNGRLPFFLLGWYPDYFDTDDYLSPFLTPSGAKSLGSDYNDTTMTQWISAEAATTNDTLRDSYFQQIQNKLAEDVPYIPLWLTNAHVAYDQDISGVYLHPVVFKYFIMNKPGATRINVGTTDRVVSLDPAKAYDYFSISAINQAFDTLLVYHPVNATLLPGLATEVPSVSNGGISVDGKTYTFHLRTGVKFHDGTPFNSTVVKWSIERAIGLDLSGSAAFLLYDIAKLGKNARGVANTNITTPDPNTVQFHLSQPVGFFNQIMAFSITAPVSMSAYSNTAQQSDEVGKVVGTGPYKLTGYVANQQILLGRNTDYYNPDLYTSLGFPQIPVMNEVSLNQYSDATALKQAIVTHQINMAYRTLNPEDVIDVQARAASLNLRVDIGTSPQIRYLVFNVKTAPFNDVKLRQAIAYSVDRAEIGTRVFRGLSVPLYSMVPPSMPFYQPVYKTKYGETPNLDQANSLLSQVTLSILDLFKVAELSRIRLS